MPFVPLSLLTPGMHVVENIINSRGQVLVPANTPLTYRHLKGLRLWGVDRANIDDSDLTAEQRDSATIEGSTMSPDELDALLNKLYQLNPPPHNHPLLEVLHALSRQRLQQIEVAPTSTSGDSFGTQSVVPGELLKIQKDGKSNTIAQLLKHSASVASPPDIYVKLMDAMHRTGSSAGSMAQVIGKDTGLTARLLKIVNSAYYSFPSRIETIPRAVTIVGTNELRDMVLLTSVVKRFSESLESVLDMNSFWKHSLACGLFTRKLALLRNEQNVERFFTMGLLHDIGRLVMYLQLPSSMAYTVRTAQSIGANLHDIERAELGFSHTQVADALCELWRLSPRQREGITYHHTPSRAKRFPVDAALLHVADILAIACNCGTSGNCYVPKVDLAAWDKLRVAPDALRRLEQEVKCEVDDLLIAFSQPQTK